MTIPTWTAAASMMSVPVNGTYVPFTAAPHAMHRFVRPALYSTGYDDYELRFSGTAFLCRYRGLAIALATHHQTGDGDGKPLPEKFIVLAEGDGQTIAVPPSSSSRPIIAEEHLRSLMDLLIYDFKERAEKHRLHTLNLAPVVWSDTPGMALDYSFLVGYPTSSQLIELDDEGRLQRVVNRWIRQDLEPSASQPLDVENRDIFVKHERSTRESIEPDGLSGSPVFSIVHNSLNERFLRFDGIVTDARGDRFAVYPSFEIRRLLDQV